MDSYKKTEIVFTPNNEPYLGSPLLKAFDDLIIATLEVNSSIAASTHLAPNMSDIQKAACMIVPQGLSLCLSIRELIRQAYLFGALTLIRPLIERSMTLLYFHHFPEKIELWNSGWKYNDRPGLVKMINEISDKMGEEQFKEIGKTFTKSLNSVVHGDPASAFKNMIELENGKYGFAVGKVLNNRKMCDEICTDVIPQMAIILSLMTGIFSDIQEKK